MITTLKGPASLFILLFCLAFQSDYGQTEGVLKVFRLLPADKVYGLQAGDRDSLLAGKTFYPADNDSSSVAAINFGVSTAIEGYMYVSLSNETSQRATGMIEIRELALPRGLVYLVSVTGGVDGINYQQESLEAYQLNAKGQLAPYRISLFPIVTVSSFLKPGVPASIRKKITDNANLTFNLSRKNVFQGLNSPYISQDAKCRNWLKGDEIRYHWTGTVFKSGGIYFSDTKTNNSQ